MTIAFHVQNKYPTPPCPTPNPLSIQNFRYGYGIQFSGSTGATCITGPYPAISSGILTTLAIERESERVRPGIARRPVGHSAVWPSGLTGRVRSACNGELIPVGNAFDVRIGVLTYVGRSGGDNTKVLNSLSEAEDRRHGFCEGHSVRLSPIAAWWCL